MGLLDLGELLLLLLLGVKGGLFVMGGLLVGDLLL